MIDQTWKVKQVTSYPLIDTILRHFYALAPTDALPPQLLLEELQKFIIGNPQFRQTPAKVQTHVYTPKYFIVARTYLNSQ